MSRQDNDHRRATKADIWQCLSLLSALPKPKGMSNELLTAAYEIALDGVEEVDLKGATIGLLQNSKFMPSPSELYQEIQRVASWRRLPQERKQEAAKRGFWIEDQAPQEPMDEAAKQRCDQLWQQVRKGIGTQRETKPEPQLTEVERLERLKRIGHEPVQLSDALLRALRDPMRPEKEGE